MDCEEERLWLCRALPPSPASRLRLPQALAERPGSSPGSTSSTWLSPAPAPRAAWSADNAGGAFSQSRRTSVLLTGGGDGDAPPAMSLSGPSIAARRANSRAQWLVSQIERGDCVLEAATSPAPGSLPLETSVASSHGNEDASAHAEAFQRGAADLTQRMEDLTRSIRFEHLNEDSRHKENEERLRQGREEERKRHDQEERRARNRERLTRDPHRKVALKLENRRRFGGSSGGGEGVGEWEGVPMRKVDFAGSGGSERVALVDVGMLRSRCRQLEKGVSVRSLLEEQRRKERRGRLGAMAKSNLQSTSSMPALHASPPGSGGGAGARSVAFPPGTPPL
mmetsp:Transcript_97619/g.209464  ORF Transcript_97619/g.209464 Transcript_97619/m.209464 type:complete len:338 (-) Transcript_97619:105-1118(-)